MGSVFFLAKNLLLLSLILVTQRVSSQNTKSALNTGPEEKKIKILINDREQARLNGDVSVGKKVLAATYRSIDEIGSVTPRSASFDNPLDTAVFRQIREANNEVKLKIGVDSFQFQFYNNAATAVVAYRLSYDLVFHNEPCHKLFQCNEVLIKQNDSSWQSVSHSETVIPGKPFAARVDPKVYEAYVGKYQLFSKKFYTVWREGDKLWFGSRQKVELIPEDEASFVENGLNYYRIRFLKNAAGKVTQMRLIEYPGVEYSATKVE